MKSITRRGFIGRMAALVAGTTVADKAVADEGLKLTTGPAPGAIADEGLKLTTGPAPGAISNQDLSYKNHTLLLENIPSGVRAVEVVASRDPSMVSSEVVAYQTVEPGCRSMCIRFDIPSKGIYYSRYRFVTWQGLRGDLSPDPADMADMDRLLSMLYSKRDL